MADHDCLRTLAGGTDVEGADGPVHAGSRQNRGTVLVPIVGQAFGRRRRSRRNTRGSRHGRNGGRMDGDLEHEVVRGRCRSAEVKKADIRVGCHAGENVRRVGSESGRVGAAVSGEGKERMRTVRRPDAHSAIPAAGAEAVLRNQVPIDAEHFAVVLLPVLHREVIHVDIEQLDASIAGASQDLVFIDLRPREVIEGVLGGKPAGYEQLGLRGICKTRCTTGFLRFRWHNAIWGQFEDKQTPIANQAEIGRTGDRKPIVEERRVLDCAAVIALCSETEHGSLIEGRREKRHAMEIGEIGIRRREGSGVAAVHAWRKTRRTRERVRERERRSEEGPA